MPKQSLQTKLTSLYGKSTQKANSNSKLSLKHNKSEDCMIVEKPVSHGGHSMGRPVSPFLKTKGEEITSATSGKKRVLSEINGSQASIVKSPISNEEAVSATRSSSFVTARAKLVSYYCHLLDCLRSVCEYWSGGVIILSVQAYRLQTIV